MEITLTTPAILFSTVSLLYVAYSTRFVAISNLIRSLKTRFLEGHEIAVLQQLENLRLRVLLIRNMQLTGVISLIVSAISMVFIYLGEQNIGFIFFGVSLLFLIYSMLLAAREIWISVISLNIELDSLEELNKESVDDGLLISHNIKKLKKVTKSLFDQETK